MNYKEIIIRAVKTFIQAFVPVLLAFLKVADFTDWSAFKTALYTTLVSAAAAGLSAVMNLALKYLNKGADGDE